MYNITFIGAGPSTIMAALELIKNNYQGKIAIVEKGNSMETRSKNEVVSGFSGAGCWSDSKLSSSLSVGGSIPNMTIKDLEEYEHTILACYNYFNKLAGNTNTIEWSLTSNYDTKDTSLNWDVHKTCHVGTEKGRDIYAQMEEYLKKQPNIDLIFNTRVKDISFCANDYVLVTDGEKDIVTEKVVLATGQKDILPSVIIDKFNLSTKSRALQLGVRVEDQMNSQYEEIIKANYDFKFVKEYDYNNVKVRVRTFCCNSGNAHVCAENTGTFICFNGHAYKHQDINNHSVNYGIMCEVEGLNDYNTKEDQIDLMKKINNYPTWEKDNFTNNLPKAKRKLLNGFDFLIGYYPQEIVDSLTDFVYNLNKLVDLSKAVFYYPEVKLSGSVPNINYNTFETEFKNLYMIGDCTISRGILKSSYIGYKFAKNILEETNA